MGIYGFVMGLVILANAIACKLDWLWPAKSNIDIDRRGGWELIFQMLRTCDIDDEPGGLRLDITHGVVDRVSIHIRRVDIILGMNEHHPRVEYIMGFGV
jgi:hypothetical protein